MPLFVSKLVVEPPNRAAYGLFLVHAEDGSVADAVPSEPIDDAVALAAIAKKYDAAPLACALDPRQGREQADARQRGTDPVAASGRA
jgi:hypothetical protein